MKIIRLILAVGIALPLSGCLGTSPNGFQDLDKHISEVLARPKGAIEPLPEFHPYEAFTYSASGKRSPFEPPIKIALTEGELDRNIKPDATRNKEYLEQFEMGSFAMVGSIKNDDGLWGLVRGEDGVHRVEIGDYMGRNHGRITVISDTEIHLIEIVSAGADFWVERPRVVRLSE